MHFNCFKFIFIVCYLRFFYTPWPLAKGNIVVTLSVCLSVRQQLIVHSNSLNFFLFILYLVVCNFSPWTTNNWATLSSKDEHFLQFLWFFSHLELRHFGHVLIYCRGRELTFFYFNLQPTFFNFSRWSTNKWATLSSKDEIFFLHFYRVFLILGTLTMYYCTAVIRNSLLFFFNFTRWSTNKWATLSSKDEKIISIFMGFLIHGS